MFMKTASETSTLLTRWMSEESNYSIAKFGPLQIEKITSSLLLNEANFGGQIAMYFGRLRQYREGGASLQAAQSAAKFANCSVSLWATIRSLNRSSDLSARSNAYSLITENLSEKGTYNAKPIIEKYDFWQSGIGLGLIYLEENMKKHGFVTKFRLGQLMSAEDIMLQASEVAALQFESTLEQVGGLPKPGLSSGNVELWLPDQV